MTTEKHLMSTMDLFLEKHWYKILETYEKHWPRDVDGFNCGQNNDENILALDLVLPSGKIWVCPIAYAVEEMVYWLDFKNIPKEVAEEFNTFDREVEE